LCFDLNSTDKEKGLLNAKLHSKSLDFQIVMIPPDAPWRGEIQTCQS